MGRDDTDIVYIYIYIYILYIYIVFTIVHNNKIIKINLVDFMISVSFARQRGHSAVWWHMTEFYCFGKFCFLFWGIKQIEWWHSPLGVYHFTPITDSAEPEAI